MADKTVGVIFKACEQLTKEMSRMRRGISRFTSFAKSAFVGVGAALGALALGKLFKSAISTAEAGDKVWRRLDVSLANVGIRFKDVEGDIRGMAAQLQATTRFGDEEYAESLGTLLGITNDYNKSLQAVRVSMGLAVKHQIDLETASQLVGRGLVGQTGTFSRYGIVVDKGRDILEQLTEATRGYAEESARGLTGALARVKNAWDDMLQALGEALIGMEDAEAGGNVLVEVLQRTERWIANNKDAIGDFVGGLVKAIQRIGEFIALWRLIQDPDKITSSPEIEALTSITDTKVLESRLDKIRSSMKHTRAELDKLQARRDEGLRPEDIEFSKTGRLTIKKALPTDQELADLQAEIAGLEAALTYGEQRLRALELGKQRPPTSSGTPSSPTRTGTPGTGTAGPGTPPLGMLGELAPVMAAVAEAAPAVGDALRKELLDPLEEARQRTLAFGEAVLGAFADTAVASGSLGQALVATGAEAIKALADLYAREQLAEAAKDLATGTWPPNPAAIKAASLHILAAKAFQALGGRAAGALTGVGGGGAGSLAANGPTSPGSFGRGQQDLSGSRGSLTIRLPQNALARTDDPVFVDWLAQGYREALERGVLDVTVEVGN